MQPDQSLNPGLAQPGIHLLLVVLQALECYGPVLGAVVHGAEDGGKGARAEDPVDRVVEADGLVRAGKEVGIGLHAVQVRIEDGRDGHHHALLEELWRSRGHMRYYKMLSRRLRASAFAQRRARRGVRDEHAIEDRNALRRRPCWLRQLLLERSDGHRPDEVFWQREVRHSGAAHHVYVTGSRT